MRGKLAGRHPMTIGAVILLGLSVYEFWVRFEDFRAFFLGVRHLSEVRGTPFLEDLAIIFEVPQMRQMAFKMLYLFAVIIFSAVCLVLRNRGKGLWVIFVLALAAAAGGVALEFYTLNGWLQILKLIPLALIAVGSITNMVSRRRGRSSRGYDRIPQRTPPRLKNPEK